MGARYPGGPRPGVRMPQIGSDFSGVSCRLSEKLFTYQMYLYSLLYYCACDYQLKVSIALDNLLLINYLIKQITFLKPPGQPMMPNNMDPSRQGKEKLSPP